MQLSYSKLSTFSQCGFRYKLRYLDRVPVKPKPQESEDPDLLAQINALGERSYGLASQYEWEHFPPENLV